MPPPFHQNLRALSLCILIISVFIGCATFKPLPLDEASLKQRAETQSEKGVRVSAAVLSAEEAETMFGRPLYKKGIQPIWLEIENLADTRVWFPPVSVDRDYFAPLEAAYLFHSSFASKTNDPFIPVINQMLGRRPRSLKVVSHY